MFASNSRYYGLQTVNADDRSGRAVSAVKLRGLPSRAGRSVAVTDSDQLEVMSELQYSDATRIWHVGDANTDLEIRGLTRTTGRVIQVPEI